MNARIFFIAVSIFLSQHAFAADWLFKNGDSQYQIVVSEDASISEKTAVKELQDYILQISGVSLPIASLIDIHHKHIFVGYTSKTGELTGHPKPAPEDESFTYRSIGNDLFIWGGSQRGTMYGVFTFLERELGVHWLTPDCTIVPSLKSWRLPKLNHHESPAIGFRHNDYHVTSGQFAWSAHNKENMRGPSINEYGNQEGYWGSHTMEILINGREFYQNHPEYFSLRNGKRVNEQLCLSNPKVLEICKERLARVMRENPEYRIYDLSQNDNEGYCRCEKCQEIEKIYGGHSGIILWFVNQVADAVRNEFPDKYIGTFAYKYSRKPPVGIVPRDNVVIRMCSFECCFAHPIEADCLQNMEFMKDLRGWAEIAPHLYIWDYIVDFAQYLAPWPNFQVLAPNIRTFRDYNAIGVYEESDYQAQGGEFEEMKSWVVNKLLWNPNQDTDSLVNIFIKGYYGKSAPKVKSYYRLCKSLVKSETHFGIFISEDDKLYTNKFVDKSLALLKDALDKAENEAVRERVEKVYMQPLYLYCMRNILKSHEDGSWDELESLMRKFNVRPNEGQNLEHFLSHYETRTFIINVVGGAFFLS